MAEPSVDIDGLLRGLYALVPAPKLPSTRNVSTWHYASPAVSSGPLSARNILGISCYYHDAAAALVADGITVAAAEEERFTRRKHDSNFPAQSIQFCLKQAGMQIDDINLIAFYEEPLQKLHRIVSCGKQWGDSARNLVYKQLCKSVHERLFIEATVRKSTGYSGQFKYIPHHLSHAASAYFPSPYSEAAILTIDGVGEWSTTGQYTAIGNTIELVREIHYPDSLGLLYSTLTAFLGFKVNNDEYKVMGLAGIGKPIYQDRIRKLITEFEDGSFKLNLVYFRFMYDDTSMFTPELVSLLGPPRVESQTLTAYHQDIAASLQAVLEQCLVQMACKLHEAAGRPDNLCLAGGVALNGVANWRLLQDTPFKSLWVQPAAGDAGGALGAALNCAHAGKPRNVSAVGKHSTLLGPEYTDAEIEAALTAEGVGYQKLSQPDMLARTAALITTNQIVGWFQGRMEFGPRALGCRSILANASNPSMQDILNSRVKFREDFRPFAPAVLADKAEEYFHLPFDSPYMLFVCPVRDEHKQALPSVTHTDGTARTQTVTAEDNPVFYDLLKQVEALSGVPIVINTSFNIRGEPIVCTPLDAVRCFLRTDIDCLVIGNYIAEKLF